MLSNDRLFLTGLAVSLITVFAPQTRAAEGTVGSTGDAAARDSIRFFEQEVRPLLAERCFRCHGAEALQAKGQLRINSRETLLTGGSRGPAISPDAEGEHLLLDAVRYQNPDLRMPPDGPLPAASVRVLERWIAMGAPWPEEHIAAVVDPIEDAIEAGRHWWSFRPVVDPAPPENERIEATSPIDQFLFARLAAAGLEPAPLANDRELARRAYLDLIGLPPTIEELDAYEADADPAKWERLVDELLASPRYGERQARSWLDIVRYSQTNGYELDDEKPYVWRYRDYVIASFNADKPYDRFLSEQLAGDALDDPTPESIVATGFYHLGPWDAEPDDQEESAFAQYDDMVRTISEGMMGVTLGCARCHDHKFDPFRQEDYYRMLAFVRNVTPYETPRHAISSRTLTPLADTPDRIQEWQAQKGGEIDRLREAAITIQRTAEKRMAAAKDLGPRARKLLRVPRDRRTQAQQDSIDRIAFNYLSQPERGDLFATQAKLEETATSFPGSLDWALSVGEYAEPKATHVLSRGRTDSPGKEVLPGYVPVLCRTDQDADPKLDPAMVGDEQRSARRALAGWITGEEHPTTWRVIVNRIWQGHFGRGIVATPNDFGAAGVPPSHPLLLDWLTRRFADDGYRLKALHRRIMTSYAYRMSSRQANPAAIENDPDNTLLWRQNLRRLDAETIRDAVLKVSGELNLEMGGESFFPALSREALSGMSRPGKGWGFSSARDRSRRSVYAYSKRGMRIPFLEVFDLADPNDPIGKRATTTTVSQALAFTNGAFLNEQASALAASVRDVSDDPATWATAAFQRVLARRPTDREFRACEAYVESQRSAFAAVRNDIVLRASVPDRLDEAYALLLPDETFLDGPTNGFTYARGQLGSPYNLTVQVDPSSGPAVFHDEARFVDANVDAKIKLADGCKFAGFVFRAKVLAPDYFGVQLLFDPEAGEVRVIEPGPNETLLVQTRPASIPIDQWFGVEVNLEGTTLVASIDQVEVIRAEVSRVRGGYFGLRAWGSDARFRGLSVVSPQRPFNVTPDDPGTPDERAFESLCLLLFNLNEFLYEN